MQEEQEAAGITKILTDIHSVRLPTLLSNQKTVSNKVLTRESTQVHVTMIKESSQAPVAPHALLLKQQA
jgi:hypothetical protein